MFGICCYILYIGISITLQRIAQTFSLKAAEDGCSLKAAEDGCSLKAAEDGCSLPVSHQRANLQSQVTWKGKSQTPGKRLNYVSLLITSESHAWGVPCLCKSFLEMAWPPLDQTKTLRVRKDFIDVQHSVRLRK